MSGALVLACGAISALGEGRRAFEVGEIGEAPAVAVDRDPWLERAGLARPVSARATWLESDGRDRATQLLARALAACVAGLERVWPACRTRKIGLCLGTSSGGMIAAEAMFRASSSGRPISRALARGATYFGPFEEALQDVDIAFSPRVQLLGACASSALSIGLAMRWLRLGRCDIALAGGYDALSVFVASGFEALHATTATRPRPFRLGRDGLALGEGAAVLALTNHFPTAGGAPSPTSSAIGYIAGFGASTDAVHLTAPDATGRGLARAARAALADGSLSVAGVGLISAHGTATSFNDSSEAKAIASALSGPDAFGAQLDGDPPGAEGRPDSALEAVHPFKAQIGHTLGAGGALEALAALDALRRRVAPASAGEGEPDPACALPLLSTHRRLEAAAALKLSSAFGGANAALALLPAPTPATSAPPERRVRAVFLRQFATLPGPLESSELSAWLAVRHPHPHRLDRMARLVVSAARAVLEPSGASLPPGSGILVGHALATLEQNELFHARLRDRGPRGVEPRRFPATSPNAAAGECAIALRLVGPSFGVGASLHGGMEALGVARDLIAGGDAPAMLVIAADLDGVISSALLASAEVAPGASGACAALLSAEEGAEAVLLEGPFPETLADTRDAAWASPWGHVELATYLGRLSGR
jgi:3-oxoacyl-[acyl-carrier-protein] synthase II